MKKKKSKKRKENKVGKLIRRGEKLANRLWEKGTGNTPPSEENKK
jgi:hypothetical protein